jgi:hypothetical protein
MPLSYGSQGVANSWTSLKDLTLDSRGCKPTVGQPPRIATPKGLNVNILHLRQWQSTPSGLRNYLCNLDRGLGAHGYQKSIRRGALLTAPMEANLMIFIVNSSFSIFPFGLKN